MENNNTDLTIEGSTATWSMPELFGEFGGTYRGTFKFRCFLTPTQRLQAGRQFREYLGSHAELASELEVKLALNLSDLSQRIISSPPFWTTTEQDGGIQGNIGDLNVIAAVSNAAMRAEEIYKENIKKERDALLERAIKAAEEKIKAQSGKETK